MEMTVYRGDRYKIVTPADVKLQKIGTSLEIQCIRIRAFTAGGTGLHPWSGN